MHDFFDNSAVMSSFTLSPLGEPKYSFSTGSFMAGSTSYRTTTQMNSFELQCARDTIDEYGEFEDDWDGYGAKPIDPVTLSNAQAAAVALLSSRALPAPDLTPNSNGTISFEWESSAGFAHLEIGKSRYAFFIKLESGDRFVRDGEATSVEAFLSELIQSALFPKVQPTPTLSNVSYRLAA